MFVLHSARGVLNTQCGQSAGSSLPASNIRRCTVAARCATACGVIRALVRCGDVVAAGRFRGRVLPLGLLCVRVCNCWCRFLGVDLFAVGSRPFAYRLRLPLLCVDASGH